MAFWLLQQQRPESSWEGGERGVPSPRQQDRAGLPTTMKRRPCGQAQGLPGFCSAAGRGLSPVQLPELPPARSRSAGCLRLEQKQRKGTLEGSETLHLAPEVALLYLYIFFLLFSF